MGFKLIAATTMSISLLLLTACAINTKGPNEASCAITEIDWNLTRKAQLSGFQCKRGDDTDASTLIFTAGIQNTTRKPLRYRLSIVLPDLKKAIGHLVPRKGVPPVVMPGDTENMTLIFENTAKWPEKAEVTLIVLPEQPELPEE